MKPVIDYPPFDDAVARFGPSSTVKAIAGRFCPQDRVEMEHFLMGDGLKLSVPTRLREAQIINHECEWEKQQEWDQVEFKQWSFM